MRGNRGRDTKPELRLRRAVYRRGLRYRCNPRIRTDERWVRPDLAFLAKRVAVFVDGCFWHSCRQHGYTPRSNNFYWEAKLARNRLRDDSVNRALLAAGWRVLRYWEHDDAELVAAEIDDVVRQPAAPQPIRARHRQEEK